MVLSPQFRNLDNVPAPNSIEETEYAAIRDGIAGTVTNVLPGWEVSEDAPVYKTIEVMAYILYLATQDKNAKLRASYRKYSAGTDLDNLVAFIGIEREDDESDDLLGVRFDTALLGNVPGTLPGIRSNALSAGVGVDDVQLVVAADGQTVTVYAASEQAGLDTTDQATLLAYLTVPGRVHLGDTIQLGTITTMAYTITAEITYDSRDTDEASLEATLRTAIYQRIDDLAKLGRTIYQFSIRSAMDVSGVLDVSLTAPSATIDGVTGQLLLCPKDTTNVVLTFTDVAP